MRGDSRLDLYAKSLALTGLGLVGAIGALIDYWPGPVLLPSVASIDVRRTTPSVQTLVDLRGLDQFPVGATPTTSMTSTKVRFEAPVLPAHHLLNALVETPLLTRESADDPDSEPVPSEPAVTAHLSVSGTELPASLPAVALVAVVDSPPISIANRSSMSPSPVALDRSDDGFLSGMLKRTGSSVSTSIGKASNSVVGAVRAVGDAVKRAF